jgi:cardiolipin synthase
MYLLAAVLLLQWGLVPRLLAQRSKSPSATLAWLWALLLFPGVGAVLFLLIGNDRLQRKRLALVSALTRDLAGTAVAARSDAEATLGMPELEHLTGFPATGGNAVDVLDEGTSFFPVLMSTITEAQQHLHVLFYHWKDDRAGSDVLDVLVAAAQRGVKVRVLIDEVGSLSLRRSYFNRLIGAGGEFSFFRTFAPLQGRFHLNLRNHRKLLVADGKIALIGGMNVADTYWRCVKSPPYNDLALRLRGPVAVQLNEVFAQDWYFATGHELKDPALYPAAESVGDVRAQVVPGAPDNGLDEVQLTMLALLHRARQTVRLMTPYFVPEYPMIAALQLAAMRGVDVAILVPAECDHFYLTHVMRSYYLDLLPYGVRILEYHPRMLHAKSITVDGQYLMSGSANMDPRSLRLNFELNVLLDSPEATRIVDALFEQGAADAHAVTIEAHQRRPLRDKIAEALFRPASALL